MKTRLISVLLALCLLGGLPVLPVWAEDEPEPTIEPPANTAEAVTALWAEVYEGDALRDVTDRSGLRCLLLPAFADLTALPLRFELAEGAEGELTLSGSLGSTVLSQGGAVDLTALAEADEEGVWRLKVTLGELPSMRLQVLQSSIPALLLRSDNPETEGRTWIDESKLHSTTASMRLVTPAGGVLYDGAVTKLKARGNTTFSYSPKKSYQIKIKKTDLIGIGEKVKTWVLLAGYTDATQLHDKLLKDLAAELGMDYVPRNDWVDLYYDGEYRGVYLLGEKNEVGQTAVDITDLEKRYEELNPGYGEDPGYVRSKNRFGNEIRYTVGLTEPGDITGGYLIELNHKRYDEVNGFLTTRGVGFNLKSPEYLGEEALCYISEYVQEFEDAVYHVNEDGESDGVNPETGKHYYEYVDRESLVRIYLIQELSNNVDAFVSSLYFYKDAGGLLYVGPVWDLDSTFGTGWNMRVKATQNFIAADSANPRYLANALMKIPDFVGAVQACYTRGFRDEAALLTGEEGRIAACSALLTPAMRMNYRIWPIVRVGDPSLSNHIWTGATYASVISDLELWVETRLSVLDERFANAALQLSYSDVRTDAYFYEALLWAYANEITQGTSPYTFSPNEPVTRAQMVTFLWRALGQPEAESEVTFADVRPGAYYEKAVRWAVAAGVTNGADETHFVPNAPCSRAQAVTFLWRAVGSPEPEDAGDPAFEDVSPGAYYEKAVRWAVAAGVTNGIDETHFSPGRICTRAQAVTFLWRAQ